MFKRHLTLKVNEHSPSRVWAKQNDTGRELEVTLTDGIAAIDLADASVTLSARKPDGRQVFISGTSAGNCVKFALTNQLLSAPGIIESEINVYKDGQRLTSARFDISVESSVQSDDAVESRDDFSAVTDALGKLGNFEGIAVRADAAADRAQTAADKAQSAAAQAEQVAEGAVPDNSISGLKLQDAVCNLLNLSKCTPQVISDDGTGTILDDIDYVLTDFIPCVPGEKYYCPGGNRRRGVWLDKNKALIKYEPYGSYGVPGVITAPDNAAFLRLSYGATSYDNVAGWDSENSMIIHGGDGYPDTYIAYGNAKADWLRVGLDNGSVTENIVSDRAITPGKIADAVINLLDLTKCTPQCIGAGEDDFGSILDDNNFVLTDYIPCSPGQEIWYPGGNRRRINYYDKNFSRIKTEIRGTWANPDKITVPNNAAYLRWSCGAVEYDGVAGWDPKYSMITYGGDSYPSAYIPYGGAVIPWLHTSPGIKSVGTEQLKNEAVTAANMSGIITNKLNLDNITAGKLSPDDGTVTDDNGYMVSAYIGIPAGLKFVCPQGQDRCICYYDSQKQYLSSDAVTGWQDDTYTGNMPEGAAYLRVSYKLEGFAVWPMLCIGTTYPDKYVPYGDTVTWLNQNPLKDKKLAVLGDSLSAWYKSAVSNAGYFNGMDYDRAVHNQSVWGSPVARHNIEDAPASFVERFSLLRDTTDYLVIQGGVNDCGLNIPIGLMTAWNDFTSTLNEYTFIGALESLFRQAQAKYPNAKILFFTSVKILHMPKLGDYMDAAKLVCNKYSVPVLDLYNCSGLNQGIPAVKSKYFDDDTHPNDWGHLLLTKTVYQFLQNVDITTDNSQTEDVKQLKSDLSDYIIDNPNANRLDLSVCESGNIDINTGNVVYTESLKLSDYIPANKGDILYSYLVSKNGTISNTSVVRYVFEFDARKKLLIRSDNIPGNPYTVASDGTAYIRMCYAAQNFALTPMLFINTDYKPKKYEAYTPIRKVDIATESHLLATENTLNTLVTEKRYNYLSYAMWKVLCIGDSLTSGAYYDEAWGEIATPGKSIDQNYPRLLGRMLGAEVTNGGFSGYSASNYYTEKLSTFDLSTFDTFIIWLGTNNGLTDTLDVDVEPYTDYNDYAETETGYYCKIIEKIKAENPNCLIVLTKIFASKGNVAVTNTVIDKIAAKYGLLVVDNSDISHTARPDLHCNISNPHFGKAGNLFIANRYIKQIGNYLHDDLLRCEFGVTSRTN